MIAVHIIFLLTCYPVLFLLYFMVRNAKDRTKWCFGVTIPQGKKKDIEVEEIDRKYRKNLKIMLIIFGILPIFILFVQRISLGFILWITWILLICFLPMYWFAKANKQVLRLKEERGWDLETTDAQNAEDACWRWGLVYSNPKDSRFMVENRMGTGTSTNMAKTAGKTLNMIGALCLLILPIIMVWMLMLDFTPIRAQVENNIIVCEHLRVEYEIPLEEIEEYTILKELPEMTKVTGNGMGHVRSGRYEIYGEGMFETFLNPQNHLFIKIKTEDETYYISGADDAQTQEIIDVLGK